MPDSPYSIDYSANNRVATVAVQNELSAVGLKRLSSDLARLAGFLNGRRGLESVCFELAQSLSREMARFIADECQRLEVPAVVSVPPLAAPAQDSLFEDASATQGSAFRVEVRED